MNDTDRATMRHLAEQILTRAERIGAPRRLLPSLGRCAAELHPGLFVDGSRYTLLTYERGIEADRFETDDEDALLYRVFIGVTQQMAIGVAMGREDYHTAFWAHQSALLGKLDPGWQERAEADRAQAEADRAQAEAASPRA